MLRHHITPFSESGSIQYLHAMAVINNLVLGLLRRRGVVNMPDARRYYAAHLEEAVNLLLLSPV